MRKILMLCAVLFCTTAIAHNIDWYVDGQIYQTTTCASGDNVTPPTPPAKYGYHFVKWAEYTPIEYLESTGTQYIDTGINPGNTVVGIEIEFALTTVANNMAICGYWDWNIPITGIQLVTNNNAYYFSIGNNGTEFIVDGCGVLDTDWHTIKLNSPTGGTQCDNQIISSYNSDWIIGGTKTLSLFARRTGTEAAQLRTPAKIKHFKIWQNYTVVRDFIPVLDSNGIPCMFDKISATFFYNSGSGNFVAGPIISE